MSELIRCTSHDEWLAERRLSLGASDAAAALGFSKWKSPFALYSEICGFSTVEETRQMRAGSHMEEFVASEFARETGLEVLPVGNSCEPYHIFRVGNLHATPDRWVVEDGKTGVLELKYSLRSWEYREPPVHYQIQLYQQMYCCGAEYGYLCGLVGGDLIYRRYEFDAALWYPIRDRLEAFYQNAIDRIPPAVDGHEATTAALNAIRPTGDAVECHDIADVFDRLAEIKERQKAQEAERAECENIIRAAMMEHTTATAGAWKASWKAQTRKAQIVVDPSYAGALESSGITFTLKAESESRVLRITKNKGE